MRAVLLALPLVVLAAQASVLNERQITIGGVVIGGPGTSVAPTTKPPASTTVIESLQSTVPTTPPVVSNTPKPSTSEPAVPTTSVPTPVPASSTPPQSSAAPPSTSSEAPPSTSSADKPSTSASSSSGVPATSVNAQGQTVILTVFPSTTSAPPSSSAAVKSDHSSNASLSTGAIVGIAVGGAAVVAAIVALALFVARRKKTNDDEEIRWPDLNHHGDSETLAPLPPRETGNHGLTTDGATRRMSIASDYDGPTYYDPEKDIIVAGPTQGMSGVSFSPAATQDYAFAQQPGMYTHQQSSFGDHGDYSSYPPAVRPQPSPVHGVNDYDWEHPSQHQYGQPGQRY